MLAKGEAQVNTSNAPSPPSCPGLAPVCRLLGFGDIAVDLELRFRISDPQNGTANLRSQVLLGVWDRFHAENIEFPVPQRDLHLASLPEIGVRVTQAAKPPAKRTPARRPRKPQSEG